MEFYCSVRQFLLHARLCCVYMESHSRDAWRYRPFPVFVKMANEIFQLSNSPFYSHIIVLIEHCYPIRDAKLDKLCRRFLSCASK